MALEKRNMSSVLGGIRARVRHELFWRKGLDICQRQMSTGMGTLKTKMRCIRTRVYIMNIYRYIFVHHDQYLAVYMYMCVHDDQYLAVNGTIVSTTTRFQARTSAAGVWTRAPNLRRRDGAQA